LTEQGSDAVTVIDELVRDAAGGILGSAGGRFFGWVIGGSVPAALAADWLVSAVGPERGRPRLWACRGGDGGDRGSMAQRSTEIAYTCQLRVYDRIAACARDGARRCAR